MEREQKIIDSKIPCFERLNLINSSEKIFVIKNRNIIIENITIILNDNVIIFIEYFGTIISFQ